MAVSAKDLIDKDRYFPASIAGGAGKLAAVKGDASGYELVSPTKTLVGLGNVDNTSDASKPVSTATQNALNLKANLSSPTFTGTPAAPTAANGTNTTQIATTAFVLANVPATVYELPEIISGGRPEGNIYGLDATTSGQIITITSGSCLDSTGLVRMKLVSNDTWTVASTNNLEQYIFLVRLVADGSFDVKGYSTFAGPASDALVDKWRFISWAKNNSSGVLMPYRQLGNRIDWTTSEKPIVTSSITGSYVSYSLTSVFPTTLSLTWMPVFDYTNNVDPHFSYDGTDRWGSLHTTGNPLELLVTSAIYIRYSSSTSAAIKVNGITLRR